VLNNSGLLVEHKRRPAWRDDDTGKASAPGSKVFRQGAWRRKAPAGFLLSTKSSEDPVFRPHYSQSTQSYR